jgi:heat shock 70kDa protein 4
MPCFVGLPWKIDEFLFGSVSTTMNMDEAVSRGCAYQCAMLSPLFQVKGVEVINFVTFPIRVSWDAAAHSTGATESMVDVRPFSCQNSPVSEQFEVLCALG